MRKWWFGLLFVLIIILTFFFIVPYLPVCDVIGSWGQGKIQQCTCAGVKVTVENSLYRDGQLKTVCIGIKLN